MPFTCTVEDRLVRVSWSDLVTREDLDAFAEEMPRLGRSLGFAPDVLHCFEAVTGFTFDPTEAFHYSRKQRQVEIPNPIRVALVATTKENEYLATVFKTLTKVSNLEMHLFFDEPSARRWLARS
jgi:hypothetical protein